MGTNLITHTHNTFAVEKMDDFIMTQTETGIIKINGTGKNAGLVMTFMPDIGTIIQINTDKTPVGISTDAGGFYIITTPDGIQYKVLPAPSDPIALSEAINGSIKIGKKGDVLIDLPAETTRAGRRSRQVVIFDPFVETAPSSVRKTEEQQKITYADGTQQKIYPTVLSPQIFIEKAKEFIGVESIRFNADGTYTLIYEGQKLIIRPNFEVNSQVLSDENPEIEASIETGENGTIHYQIETTIPSFDKTRRGRGSREVLSFDPFIEVSP